MKFLELKNCPVCKSTNYKVFKYGYQNLYSEQIALKLNISEKVLIKKLKNLKCSKCGLIYKSKWFNEKILKTLFNKIISVHPKGWDANSKKFSQYFFKKNINLLEILLKYKSNRLQLNKLKRELTSIIDSIKEKDSRIKILKFKAVKSIENNDIKSLKKNFYLLKENFKDPEDFKRFKGFNSSRLNSFIQDLTGEIKTYTEVGCPLWGSIENFNKAGVECNFIKGKPHEFWGSNCKKNNILCHQKLSKNIKKFSSFPTKKKKVDYTAIYLYLDHVLDPYKFLKKIFRFSRSVGLILEHSKSGVPVQHFTGWSAQSVKYLAKKLNKKVYSGFDPLNNTGKDFYLLK